MQKTRNKTLLLLIFLVGMVLIPNRALAETLPDKIGNIYELRDNESLKGYTPLRIVAGGVANLGHYLGTETQYLPYKISASSITGTGRDATVTGINYAVYCTFFGKNSPAQNSYVSYCGDVISGCSATANEQKNQIPAYCTKKSGWDEGTKAGVAYIIKQAGGRTFGGTSLGNYYNAESTINQFLYAVSVNKDICNIQKCNADSTGGTNSDNKIVDYNTTDVNTAKALRDTVNAFTNKGALTINAPASKELTYDDEANVWKSSRFSISNLDKYPSNNQEITVVLKDANGKTYPGYAYITNIGSEVQVGVCNKNNGDYCKDITNFKKLTSGTYTVEITAKGTYSYDIAENYDCGTLFQSITPAITDTVNANEKQSITFNLKIADELGSIKIKKVDADTNEEVTGATITVRGKDNDFNQPFTLTNKSTITINNLKYGTYEIIETKAPNGYEKDTRTYEVVISKDHLLEEVVISNKRVEDKVGIFSILKIDESGNKLGGSTFEYYYDGDDSVTFENVTKDGVRITDVTLNKRICLEETKAPNGYKLNSKKFCFKIIDTGEIKLDEDYDFIKITKNKTMYVLNVINYPVDKSIVKIKKVDSKDNTKVLAGAKLHIIDESGKEVVEPWITTTEEFVITDLKAGKYYIEELEAPEGYTLNKTKQEFTIESNETRITIEFINEKPVNVPNTLSNISKLIILLAVSGILVGAILVYKNKFSEDGIK